MGRRIVVVIVNVVAIVVVVANQSLTSWLSIASSPSRPHIHVALAVIASNRRVQGRLLHWHPEKVQMKKALPASYPGLLARFAKETSLSKREMFPDIDHMDRPMTPIVFKDLQLVLMDLQTVFKDVPDGK